MKNKILLLFTTATFLTCSNSEDGIQTVEPKTVATYDIIFTNYWNETDHGPLPNNSHWSPLIGVNHNSEAIFLEIGGIASQGIEDIAEDGINTNFQNDVLESVSNGNSEQYISGSSLYLSNGNVIEIKDLEISQDFPFLTLVSMIAPSPDWMVFINGFNLRNTDDSNWKDSIQIDLFVYDAGTDSGISYSAPNSDTTPHVSISSLKGIMPFNDSKVATLDIILKEVSVLTP